MRTNDKITGLYNIDAELVGKAMSIENYSEEKLREEVIKLYRQILVLELLDRAENGPLEQKFELCVEDD